MVLENTEICGEIEERNDIKVTLNKSHCTSTQMHHRIYQFKIRREKC
jgi:hypothetical protein